jgi:hypothetical protein
MTILLDFEEPTDNISTTQIWYQRPDQNPKIWNDMQTKLIKSFGIFPKFVGYSHFWRYFHPYTLELHL